MSTQKELYYCYDFILDFTIKSEKANMTCISIALAVNKEFEIGIIYNPVLEHLFIIRKGHGAYFNEKLIKSSSSIEGLEHSSLCLKILYATIKNIHDIILRRLEAFVSITHEIRIPWDAAAGIFIIKEIGGIVIDTNSGEFNVMSSKLLTVANCKLAKELIKLIKILKCGEDEKVIYNKNEGDFVTNYNQQIEKLFIDSLSKEFPNHRIIAEETVFAMQKMPELTDAPTWFLDPIDGTINFMHSLPYFNISIALMIRKVLVLGIIYNPSNSEFYTATKGKSAFLNGKPIHVSNITVLLKILRDSINGFKHIKEKLGDWDLVTEYDRQIEDIIIGGLKRAFSNHRFIAEESTGKDLPELTDAPTWIIDPIDGTTNFIHGFPHTCVVIGLAVKKEMVLGIVYNPILEQLFTARKGRGAFLNGKPIQVSKIQELSKALVCMESGFIKVDDLREKMVERIQTIVKAAQGIRTLGVAALTLCYIALGIVEAYYIEGPGISTWDIAAASLIISEAGGVVVDRITGEPIDIMKPRAVAACNERIARDVVRLIREADHRVDMRTK
ncbi:IMPA2 monophosphatase, partial [Acromyrmex charruanus]